MNAQYVTLGASGEVFGAPVEMVQEILDTRPIARLPQMPSAMLGIIDVRGQTIPVVDLRRALGFEAADDTANTRILVIGIGGTGGTGEPAMWGVRADRVFEVTGLDGDGLEPPASIGGDRAGGCVAGIGRRHGRFVTVLDFDRLLRHVDAPRP